ncbi:gamma-glutamylcyclotransferase family protein [Methylophilus sp.]|uniref:gamma-glutamylcyclotransferase family protein n=1 Tax=Methylophilus sp. TaxID=29541 RepID=UPI0040369362
MSDLLFVYGTLRKGNSNSMAEYLSTQAEFLTQGRFQGRMYQISYYPGVLASGNANEQVCGEVYRLHDAQATLSILDEYEECSSQDVQTAEYKRVTTRIDGLDGNVFEQVWIYLYQWPVTEQRVIKTGDFMQMLQKA